MRHTSLPPRLGSDPPVDEFEEQDGDIQMHSDSEQQHQERQLQYLDQSLPAKPPARIAARISKTRAAASRKSSASSSRRNSFSSLQSGRSNRSCHGGPFSTHVAQHLRRASIIDARRARLAERAAHAEQVRLRAQAAKAAPRSSRSPEERALAAHEARERHLAQVAAACAEEVKRAKKVAEDMKERKEKEEERMRAELEEKHANAERRRLLFEQQREARRRRNSSNTRLGGLPAVEENRVKLPTWKPKNRDLAAKVVQKAWREYRLRKIVANFLSLELDVEHVQAATFEDASELLLQEQLIFITRSFMQVAQLLDARENAVAEGERVRTFLSAYLVLCHPQQVLSNHGTQEEDLINKAKILLMEIQHLLTKKATLAAYSLSSNFIQSLRKANDNFQAAFQAWKAGDASTIIDTMVLQFVELDAIMRSVKNDTAGGVAEDYQQGIRQNQTMIILRLKRLVGHEQAMKTLLAAVKKRQKEDLAKRKLLKHKPRVTSSASAATQQTPVLAQSRAQSHSNRAQDPIFSSRDFAQVIAPLPDNRTLIHELSLDRDWRMDPEKTREVRQTVRQAIYHRMREDLITGNGDHWILNMVETIREKLLRTVNKGGSMHRMLSENLDTELIKKQLSSGTFSHQRFFSYMASVLPKLVSPARDADVRDFARDDGGDFTERLEKLFRIIDYLSLDYANWMLQQTAPKLIQSAAPYESECFTTEFGPGTVNIPLTKAWWRSARLTTVNDLTRRPGSPHSPAALTPPPTPPRGGSPLPALALKPTAERVYTTGLVDLFIGLPVQDIGRYLPETLKLDAGRVTEARSTVRRIITTSTVLLTAKNALKRDVRTPWKNVAQRMWDISCQADDHAKNRQPGSEGQDLESLSASYLAAVESAQALPPAVKNAVVGTIKRVLSETATSQESTSTQTPHHVSHPVLRVLLNKLRANVLGRVLGGEEERRRRESASAEALATAGMVEHVERVKVIVDTLQRVKRVDWDSHKTWLNMVREEVDEEVTAVPN